jgi:tRNA dimethylallyltransferase
LSKLLFFSIVSSQNFKEYSRNFEFGIFQSIGFKEFDDYFKLIDGCNQKTENYETSKKEIFEKCVEEMKLSTRKYAKTQIKWVKNRFIKS